MTQPAKNTTLVFSGLLAILCLWLPFFTLENAAFNSGLGSIFESGLRFSGSFTGLSGQLFGIPVWLIIALVCLPAILQLMEASSFFHVPNALLWGATITAIVLATTCIVYPVFYAEIRPAIGPFAILLSSLISVTMLMMMPCDDSTEGPTDAKQQMIGPK